MWNQKYLKAQYLDQAYSCIISMTFQKNIKYTVRLFANDTIVYLAITADVDRVHPQEDLDRLVHWQETWKMSFYPEKCFAMSITKKLKRNPVTNCYILHGHQLE